jgi:hypothetical protein
VIELNTPREFLNMFATTPRRRGMRGRLPESMVTDVARHREALKRRHARHVIRKADPNAVCAVCGSANQVERHHPDYDKPFETIPLCHLHHRGAHAREKASA